MKSYFFLHFLDTISKWSIKVYIINFWGCYDIHIVASAEIETMMKAIDYIESMQLIDWVIVLSIK